MASMIVVSNRLPFVLKPSQKNGAYVRQATAGGLVTAMAPVVRDRQGVWVGWPGVLMKRGEKIPEADESSTLVADSLKSSQIQPVNIEDELFDGYYNGCCNGTFWPLLHSMPDRCVFKRQFWKDYSAVNALFARETVNALVNQTKNKPEKPPLVWIHDYQLMLVPTLVRESLEEKDLHCSLAFFLHIPFPSYDVFQLFPWDDEILTGLLGCDLIGFHVEGYAANFIDCCHRRLGCRVDRENMLVEHDGRTVQVGAFPIGIPFDQFERISKEQDLSEVCDHRYKTVLGVDRLDYTKGILLRVKAFERLLENYPEHVEKVILYQIAVPSRTDVPEYQILKDELEREIGRINGQFSTINWSPIRYIYRSLCQRELCAFYRDASVALVTPIRDGMNLVAKEFVACQTGDPGVLLLSPFTGAGQTMLEALIVNPMEEYELADTIHRALTMPKDERELRMAALRRRESTNDIHHWLQTFLDASGAENGSFRKDKQLKPLTVEDFEKWMGDYVGEDCKLALLLDYDGTLAPIAAHPDIAFLPDETKKILELLAETAGVHVAVISGRNVNNLQTMVAIDNITYAGNHGLDIVHPDGTKFIHPDQVRFATLIGDLKKELEMDVCHDGAWVEDKGIILTYHYRSVPVELRQPMIDACTAIITKHGFRACKSHCAMEARPPIQWDKGRACIHVLRTTFGVDWTERVRIIYVGDDATDEDAMRVLSGVALTFRVSQISRGRTAATRRLPGTASVLTMLKWTYNHMNKREQRRRTLSNSASSPTSRLSPSAVSPGALHKDDGPSIFFLRCEMYYHIIFIYRKSGCLN